VSIAGELLARHRERLAGFPAPLVEQYELGLRGLATRLSASQLQQWAETGVELTSLNLRSWEAATEYFRAASDLAPETPWDAIEHLGREALTMAVESTPLAVSLLRAAPPTLAAIGPSHVRQWADLGRRLYKGNWKSSALAGQFYELSPRLFDVLPVVSMSRLVLFVDELARHSYELAAACLASAPDVLGRLDDDDRTPFLTYAVELAQSSWADSRLYFERGSALVHKVHAPVRERYLLLAAGVARGLHRSAFQYLEDSANALGVLSPEDHSRVIELAEQLAVQSPFAAMDFITNLPQVLQSVRLEDLEPWHLTGLDILRASRDGGEAYFRLQSTRGEDVLEHLSSRVELSKVGEILRLYAKALTGRDVSLHPTAALTEKGIGWADEQLASTEGTTIYLPDTMERYRAKEDNFAAYKVFATHQAGRLEFGSFSFSYRKQGKIFGAPTPPANDGPALTDMERFFNQFAERRLASDLFKIAEDARVDTTIKVEYGGIRRPLTRMQTEELERRPEIREMPLRDAFVENLVRYSLGGRHMVEWPRDGGTVMAEGLGLMDLIMQPDATVEDAAEVAVRMYALAMSIANVVDDESEGEWDEVESIPPDAIPMPMGGQPDENAMPPQGGESEDGEDGEEEYSSPQPVDFRGDFKPEMVQLLTKLREGGDMSEGDQLSPQALTPEQLKELLEKSTEIDLDHMEDGELDATTGMFLANLMKEARSSPHPDQDKQSGKTQNDNSTGEGEGEQPLEQLVTTYYYDEWDFRAQDYKPRWCAVKETTLAPGNDDFYERTLREHAGLVAQTRKQFELMKPEMFRKIKRLPDGEDLDIDAAIEWFVEHRIGANPNEKVYWRRNKVERDVAVAFLVDMSASTDEEIQKRDRTPDNSNWDDDPQKYLSWWADKRRQELSNPPKRIIDLEKESTVLLMTALETIGDQYGIYGFSGYGRDNVEFFVIKDIHERLDQPIRRRLDNVTPIRSTRMGPAIRHATHKLSLADAKVKILVLLSDGRPQDHGYGRDRTEKEYAIHDTKQALNEAKRIGITPFALTVDRAGHDYLKTMCEDMGYEVVADIEALPSRLPTLYRRLTE